MGEKADLGCGAIPHVSMGGDEEDGIRVALKESLSHMSSNSERGSRRSLVDNAAISGFEGTGTWLRREQKDPL
jgi:hypothetical protein